MITLETQIGDRSVYRRTHTKADGRQLVLYGYTPHELPLLAETNDEVAKGGELRWHPFRQEWNIYAAHRQNRTYKPSAATDPLAPTQPDGLPTEIPFSDFEVAVFENKFTSLHREALVPPVIDGVESKKASGHCDVIVYSAAQTGNLFSVGQDRRRLLVAAWADRYETLLSGDCAYVMPFESRGEEVGVTLHHPHGQIYGFSEVPLVERLTAKAFADGYDLKGAMRAWGESYEVEIAGGVRALCPPYARFPLETWLVPERSVPGPWEMTEEELDGFAFLLGDMTRRYDAYFERETAYMLTLHAAPRGTEESYHFTAQFYPILRAPNRVKFLASVEQGTGVFTVDVMPETAADMLRAQ